MKKICVALICVFILAGCEGPTGPAGEDGNDLNVTILTGVLTSGGLVDAEGWFSTDYWLFNTYKNLDNAIIDVRIRQGSGHIWNEALWNLYGTYIYLYYSGDVRPGWEYRILIAG